MLAARPDKMGQAAAAFPGAVLQPDDVRLYIIYPQDPMPLGMLRA